MKSSPPQPGTLLAARTHAVLMAAAPEPMRCTCLLWGIFLIHLLDELKGRRCPSQGDGEVSWLGKDHSSPSLMLSLACLNLGV